MITILFEILSYWFFMGLATWFTAVMCLGFAVMCEHVADFLSLHLVSAK